MKTARPLQGRYGAMLTAAVLSLVPFIITSTAYVLFSKNVGDSLGVGRTTLELVSGMAIAAYAFGALMGGDIINRFPQRRLFLALESLFVIGAVVAAISPTLAVFGAGDVLQGLSTGFLLVVAVPPVVRGFPASKMPITAASINMGFFGAITAGPLLGGVVAATHAWRWYFGGLAIVGMGVLLLAALSLPDQKPQNPGMPFDWHAVLLAVGATFLPFYASGVLAGNGFASFRFTVPLAVGLASFVALLLTEYHKQHSLSPVKPMWNTFPVIGTVVAMAAGGVFVTLLELGLRFISQVQHRPPLMAGLEFWPLLPGVIVSAAALGVLVRSRYLPVFILTGMLCLVASGALLSNLTAGDPHLLITVAAGLLGVGAGSTVSPALWMAGFSLPSKLVGRIFALVELVRSVADFILAPVILEIAHVASQSSSPTPHGIAEAAWYTMLVTIGCTALCVALYIFAGPGLPTPDLEAWLKQARPAIPSPMLAAAVRDEDHDDDQRDAA